jgi:hypothetical protein
MNYNRGVIASVIILNNSYFFIFTIVEPFVPDKSEAEASIN